MTGARTNLGIGSTWDVLAFGSLEGYDWPEGAARATKIGGRWFHVIIPLSYPDD